MCGIVGALARGRDPLPWRETDILAAARTLRHRGPDAQTAWADPQGRCLLGHARLKVIDLETGAQPMGNQEGSVQVVFNGEIYNFRELRRELEGKGYPFRTRSDTEVLIHGWDAWGEGMVERLDGMFAFGLWDGRTSELFLARDRVGKKPLFLYEDEGIFVFASEMKAILSLPGIDDSILPSAFPLYLAYGYVPAPRTFYQKVTKLPPAHTRRIRIGAEEEVYQRYWAPDFRPSKIEKQAALEKTRALVTAAVKKRLIADVPLGALLSGGVDSTIVVGLMAGMSGSPVRTFSIGFADDDSYDETKWAREAAARFETQHTEFRVEADSVDLINDLIRTYDEPFGDSSAIPTWLVSKLTRNDVTVALTGDGGDELFGGYPRFLGMRFAEAFPRPLIGLGKTLSKPLPYHSDFRHPTRRVRRFFESAELPFEARWLKWVGFFSEAPWALLRPGAQEAAVAGLGGADRAGNTLLDSLRLPEEDLQGATALGRAMAVNFESYLPEDLLVKADRNSMAHGLEFRSPLLDTALIEFAGSLPDWVRNPMFRLKGILKEAFKDLIPDGIRKRRKMGFAVPLPTWFRTHWRPHLEETLLSPEARIGEWLRPEPVRALVEEHWSGKVDRGQELWALLTLGVWLRGRE